MLMKKMEIHVNKYESDLKENICFPSYLRFYHISLRMEHIIGSAVGGHTIN